MKRTATVLLFAFLGSGCGEEESSSDGGGGGSTNENNPLHLNPGGMLGCNSKDNPIERVSCEFRSGDRVFAGVDGGDYGGTSYLSLTVIYPNNTPGTAQTEYGGIPTSNAQSNNLGGARVIFNSCYKADTAYTPDPCDVELQKIEHGTRETVVLTDGQSATIERDSKVTMEVRCPEELYSPGADDYGPTPRKISPNEFVIEAKDCIVE